MPLIVLQAWIMGLINVYNKDITCMCLTNVCIMILHGTEIYFQPLCQYKIY